MKAPASGDSNASWKPPCSVLVVCARHSEDPPPGFSSSRRWSPSRPPQAHSRLAAFAPVVAVSAPCRAKCRQIGWLRCPDLTRSSAVSTSRPPPRERWRGQPVVVDPVAGDTTAAAIPRPCPAAHPRSLLEARQVSSVRVVRMVVSCGLARRENATDVARTTLPARAAARSAAPLTLKGRTVQLSGYAAAFGSRPVVP